MADLQAHYFWLGADGEPAPQNDDFSTEDLRFRWAEWRAAWDGDLNGMWGKWPRE